ncbi:MAG: TPM domain-containing protein [Verrucomicrobiaceae bacterium]|nr:TPM domain-containing protein [Verrucomicrobiaceae bacterium]
MCEKCGFSAAKLKNYLGDQWIRLERITDAAHLLRLEEHQACELALDDFERAFPQAFIAIYLGALPNEINVSELGFWLLNQGAFHTHLLEKRNDYGLVLVIDPFTRSLALTAGYGIEPCLHQKKTQQILKSVAGSLAKNNTGEALLCMIADLRTLLQRAAVKQPRSPKTGSDHGLDVQPLRTGHRMGSHLSPLTRKGNSLTASLNEGG